ncbi:unnamed protein product [Arctogadus glacialis]
MTVCTVEWRARTDGVHGGVACTDRRRARWSGVHGPTACTSLAASLTPQHLCLLTGFPSSSSATRHVPTREPGGSD